MTPDRHFSPSQLHVICVLNNPLRYASRLQLFQEFQARVRAAGAHLVTVEAKFQDRKFEVTSPTNPDDVQITQYDEVWLKECLINAGVKRLPQDWEYVAWVDGDVGFSNANWVTETIHQLQHYHVVQLFQTAINLGPTGQALTIHNGFAYSYVKGLPRVVVGSDLSRYQSGTASFWHPGYGWAWNREAWDSVGGMLDMAILGAGDHHMALGLIGEAAKSLPGNVSANYDADVMRWQERTTEYIKGDIGYVSGSVLHYWHGKIIDRRYEDRWKILQKWHYDPVNDVQKDWQGVWRLTPKGLRMRDDLRAYFRSRNEDSIDLEK